MSELQCTDPVVEHNRSTLKELKALQDMDAAILNERQNSVLQYYLKRGRKHGIGLSIISDAPQSELLKAKTSKAYDAIVSKYPSKITVYGFEQSLMALEG